MSSHNLSPDQFPDHVPDGLALPNANPRLVPVDGDGPSRHNEFLLKRGGFGHDNLNAEQVKRNQADKPLMPGMRIFTVPGYAPTANDFMHMPPGPRDVVDR